MTLADLRGEERETAEFLLRWAQGLEPEGGPDPRGVCSWLVDAVIEGGDPEAGYRAACELVLLANGYRRPRARPVATPRLEHEPVVRHAHELLR